jgi:hypothetical protein
LSSPSIFFAGKQLLKVKCDFNDPHLWVLAVNNEVYGINSLTQQIDDYSAMFSAYRSLQFIDIAGRSRDTVLLATNSANLIQFKNGSIKLIGRQNGITDNLTSIGIDYTNGNAYYTDASDNNHSLYSSQKNCVLSTN